MQPYLEVSLPEDVVRAALRELAPLRIHLAPPTEDRRWIELDPPEEVTFEPGLGVRVVTRGKLKFELASVKIPAYLEKIIFRLSPRIVQAGDSGHRAAIPLDILEADLRFVPGVIDDWLVSQVNKALTPRASKLVWRFDEALSAEFEIADRLQPLGKIGLRVTDSTINVMQDKLVMRVCYDIDIQNGKQSTP